VLIVGIASSVLECLHEVDGNLDGERLALTLHSHLVIDRADKMLHLVQDGLNLELNS
jgi:hypothetical protein